MTGNDFQRRHVYYDAGIGRTTSAVSRSYLSGQGHEGQSEQACRCVNSTSTPKPEVETANWRLTAGLDVQKAIDG